MRKVLLLALAAVFVFAAGCGQAVTPEMSGTTTGNTEASTTTETTTGTTTTSEITETTVQEYYDVDAIRAALQAELLEDSLPKKIIDCTQYGNYLFIFCDPILSEGEKEDDMGGWLYRYNLKTGMLERHYNRLPLSRYIILSETRVVGEGGRLIGFEPFIPALYDLTFTEEGPRENSYGRTYHAVSGEYSSWTFLTSSCSLERADADAGSFSFLYGRSEWLGVGSGIPDAAWKISVSDGMMTILFDDMEPGKLVLGDLGLSNVFFESAELKEIEGKTAVVLKLTKYARYFALEVSQIVSPETFSSAQFCYSAMRVTFTVGQTGAMKDPHDVGTCAPPNGCFESYMQRLEYTDAVLVTLPQL